ncbi:hypothetical protein HUG15_15765 [Salicibibacter cibarius]|uniref:Uncharacterized protein n=2 Tax=Salicibibacter cibarius TaxID=2743000 RepID=A0A7T7CCE6_9BACI|nr:hypothetical protein HUG15_15765 [Salicibibacter cibarius]
MEAYEEIQSLDLDGEEQGILENAQDKWGDDYEMVLEYEPQLESYENLN